MTLKVIHRLQAFSNAISGTFVQHLTRFQLTMCSHRPSALAELLVLIITTLRKLQAKEHLVKRCLFYVFLLYILAATAKIAQTVIQQQI